MSAARLRARAGRAALGLTTVELLLGIAVTVVAGAAVVATLRSATTVLTSSSDERSALQRSYVLRHRLTAFTETALCVLEADARGVALWQSDEDGNGRVNLSELLVFHYDAQAGTLTREQLQFPAKWPVERIQEADTILANIDDPFATMETQRGLGMTVQSLTSDGIESLTAQHAGEEVRTANRVLLTAGFAAGADGDVQEIVIAVAMPQHREPN